MCVCVVRCVFPFEFVISAGRPNAQPARGGTAPLSAAPTSIGSVDACSGRFGVAAGALLRRIVTGTNQFRFGSEEMVHNRGW